MQYFCSCHICKINPGGGKWLFTKKTFKKYQEKEKAFIEKINESETKSSSESISSYIVARKRKFDDELDESDINLVNSLLDNERFFNGDNGNPNQDYNNYNKNYNNDDDNQSFDENYNDNNPNQNYNNYNENYNGDNDNQSLDEDYNDNDPSQDYNNEDNPSLDNNENDKVENIETESDISDENDELTEMDNKFKDIEDINDGIIYLILH
ncbi:hypothetical protein RclHR1_10440002 [Rhizophagus clarus]|uniref:Uncharacterized protein n=1 Tax=Rhizophagus clarus TaxID=94130 RepID=A0A2Z6QDJ1_9GLOM|nr:hypothetical protein RclHR1_10440002 [Rhizophagus clarus]